MGRTEDGGLGWPPSEFWNSTVYDIEMALEFAQRRVGAVTSQEKDAMLMRMRDQRQQEADERAARGDRRTHEQIIRAMIQQIEAEGKTG